MKIINEKISGLPDTHQLLLLGSIHENQIFFVVIIEKDMWDGKSGLITGAQIAIGISEHELTFIPVASLLLKGFYREKLELIANEGAIEIKGFYENIRYGVAKVPVKLLNSVFHRAFLIEELSVDEVCALY